MIRLFNVFIFIFLLSLPFKAVLASENNFIPIDTGQYLKPSFKNFEYILWRFGGYTLDDENDILRFIAFNDCALYNRYQNYDIEWKHILEKYRQFLSANYKTFPRKITVEIPIGLKRFDQERSAFPLSEETQFLDIRLLPIKRSEQSSEAICKLEKSALQRFKKFNYENVFVSLKYPLTLKEIPVPAANAREYIEFVQRNNQYHKDVNGRIATAHYSISFFDYIRRLDNEGAHLLYGQIDKVEIYADKDKSRLLYAYTPKNNQVKRESLVNKAHNQDE